MINRKFIIPVFIFFFFAEYLAFTADNTVDPRETAIDRAIGGMVEGSRPLSSQSDAGKNQIHKVPGANLSPGMDTKVTASASTQDPSNPTGIGSSVGNSGGAESGNTAAGAGNTGANLGGTTPESTTGGNLEGNVSGGTSGGTLEGGANVGTETGGTTTPETEPTGGGSVNDSIVNVDANVDLSGGTPAVDANLEVDTNAQGGLLDANAAGTTDAGSTEVAVVESGQIAGQDLTETVESAPVDAVLETEVVAADVPADNEASAGLEASVDETGAGDDVTVSDPADGLSNTPNL